MPRIRNIQGSFRTFGMSENFWNFCNKSSKNRTIVTSTKVYQSCPFSNHHIVEKSFVIFFSLIVCPQIWGYQCHSIEQKIYKFLNTRYTLVCHSDNSSNAWWLNIMINQVRVRPCASKRSTAHLIKNGSDLVLVKKSHAPPSASTTLWLWKYDSNFY